MNAGVAGVVAIRYNLYVLTVVPFVAELYATLVPGAELPSVTPVAEHCAVMGRQTEFFRPRSASLDDNLLDHVRRLATGIGGRTKSRIQLPFL